MNVKELIGKHIITKTNERIEIVESSGEDIKNIILKLKNKKIYNLYLGYKSGFIKFEEEELNNELDKYVKEEETVLEEKRQKEETIRRDIIERERKEKERLENPIKEFRGDYSFLSNFHTCKIEYEGYTYQNVEAAFQAQKDLTRRSEFENLTPTLAKRLGRKVNLRSDWENVKVGIMKELVKCKFDHNPELKEKLLETGDRLLIEGNTWNDTFWGVCKGKGKNTLGEILMELRNSYHK